MSKAFGVSVLIRKDGLFLGVARRNDPNDWGLPGGKCEEHETEIEAAVRETFEETGLKIWNLKEVYRGLCGKDEGVTFICDWEGEPAVQPGEPECKWVTSDTLRQGCFGEYNTDLFKILNID
jgi:8-oxo-dGTP pyrophosphatase MutT (NUDIX family)